MQIECSKGKLACLYCRDAAADDEIVQIESRAQVCLSMTEMQAMTRSVNIVNCQEPSKKLGLLAL